MIHYLFRVWGRKHWIAKYG